MDAGKGYEPVSVADVNGDRRADLVAYYFNPSDSQSKRVRTFLGQANGTFSAPVDSFSAPPPTSGTMDSALFDGTGYELLAVMDLGRDGYGDLLAADPAQDAVVGFRGYADGHFSSKRVNDAGREILLWVVDRSNIRVQKLGEGGEFLLKFGSFGSANGQLRSPRSFAIDAAGNFWVADTANSRVQRWIP